MIIIAASTLLSSYLSGVCVMDSTTLRSKIKILVSRRFNSELQDELGRSRTEMQVYHDDDDDGDDDDDEMNVSMRRRQLGNLCFN